MTSRFLNPAMAVLALKLLGCASLPETLPMAPQSFAQAPQPGGALAAVESSLQQKAGPGQSGFYLLDSNEQGLRWRLALIAACRLPARK